MRQLPRVGRREVGDARWRDAFGRVDALREDAICCPQIAVATPMGFEILTRFDNVSVEPYPWLCIICVCGGVIVCVCTCVRACVCTL